MWRLHVLAVLFCLWLAVPCQAARKRGNLPSSDNGVANASECPLLDGEGDVATPLLARFDGHSPKCDTSLGNPSSYPDHSVLLANNSNFAIQITPIAWMNGFGDFAYTILEVRFTVKTTNTLTGPELRTLAFQGNLSLIYLPCNEPAPSGVNSSSFTNGDSFHTGSVSYGTVPACMATPNLAIPPVDGVVVTQYDGDTDLYVAEPDVIYDTVHNVTVTDFPVGVSDPYSISTAYLVVAGVPAAILNDSECIQDIFNNTSAPPDYASCVQNQNPASSLNTTGLDYSLAGVHYVVQDAQGNLYEGGSVPFTATYCTQESPFLCTPPNNDSVTSPAIVTSGFFQSAEDVSGATPDPNGPQSNCYDGDSSLDGFSNNSQFTPNRTVWYEINVQTPGPIAIDTSGSRYDTRIDVFSGLPSATATSVACADDYPEGTSQQTQVQAKITSFTPAAAGPYYIMVSETAKPTGSPLQADGDLVPPSIPSPGDPLPQPPSSIPFATSAILTLEIDTTALKADQSQLTFPTQPLNVQSQSQTITISGQVGSGFFAVGSLTPIVPKTTGDFSVASNGCTGIKLLTVTCTIQVAFTPTAAGTRTGTLSIASSAVIGPLTIPLSGTGNSPTPLVTFGPAPSSFGQTFLHNQSPAQTVTLQNTGTLPVTVSSVSLTGTFKILSQTCGSTPFMVAAGASCAYKVAFTPTALGSATGSLTISDNASTNSGTQSVALSGQGFDVSITPTRPGRPSRPSTPAPAGTGTASPAAPPVATPTRAPLRQPVARPEVECAGMADALHEDPEVSALCTNLLRILSRLPLSY